jgi:hypothetical protein
MRWQELLLLGPRSYEAAVDDGRLVVQDISDPNVPRRLVDGEPDEGAGRAPTTGTERRGYPAAVNGGHLFVVDGDLTRLACDAWLLPTDTWFNVTASFAEAVGMPGEGVLPGFSGWPDGSVQPFNPNGRRPGLGSG